MTPTHTGRPPSIPQHGEDNSSGEQCPFWKSPTGLVAIGFVLITGSLFLFEHRLHVLGYLPFLVLLACPLMHVFMHRGHGHGSHGDSSGRRRHKPFGEE